MANGTDVTIDRDFLEWTDLCMLVASETSIEAFQRWAFVVGTDGTPAERLVRGRTAYARVRGEPPLEGKRYGEANATA